MSDTFSSSLRSPPASRSAGRRDLWFLLILLALFVAGAAGLVAVTGWEDTKAQLQKLTWVQIGGLLLLSLVNYFARGLRWHLFARRLGLPTGLRQNLRHFLGGFAMSVTPGRVGELVRMRWLKRETGWAVERTAPLALVDRASDLVAMAAVLALALSLSTAGIAGAVPVIAIAILAAWAVTRPALLVGIVNALWRVIQRAPRLFARARSATRTLSKFRSGWVLSAATVLGLVGWLAEGWAFYLLLTWMGADIMLWGAIGIFVFATLAGGATGAPGGMGGAEAAMIALLGLQGVPLEIAIPATAIIRVTTFWFAIAIGLVVFPIAERRSGQACS